MIGLIRLINSNAIGGFVPGFGAQHPDVFAGVRSGVAEFVEIDRQDVAPAGRQSRHGGGGADREVQSGEVPELPEDFADAPGQPGPLGVVDPFLGAVGGGCGG